jgi:hypothetical protein
VKKRIASCVGIEESVAGKCMLLQQILCLRNGGNSLLGTRSYAYLFFIEVCHNIYRVDTFKIRKIELLALASYSGIVQDHDVTMC